MSIDPVVAYGCTLIVLLFTVASVGSNQRRR